ncbi:SDR family oxidoreductase [Marinobacter sp. 71-i]|uniref:SDR family oxidoreductase n=1 Tax=Marinobacter iranensis TaxID=2962607 RepID=A0ABT5Y8X0_9GAMM|nr:SDR family oxidoreductase [Marinobacter iranensis]MDF0750098.1 SDR family oxidoreductase [Marinobacter iranensis]
MTVDSQVGFQLNNKKVLVTGASSGLGHHFARTLAASGARVVVGARRVERLEGLVAEITESGGQADAVSLDVTSRDSVSAALDHLQDLWGGVDVVVNNAGVSDTKSVLNYDDGDWDNILDTNLKGAWIVAQEAARRMVDAGTGGNIVNITSILGNRVGGGVGPYSAAKAGLSHLTRSMALELARHDIRVNALAPGYVVTEINQDLLASDVGERLRKRIPNRRFCQFEDLDGPLLLLVSDASKAMTGAEIVVDNGHSCMGL